MSAYRSKKAGEALRVQLKLEKLYDEAEALGTPKRIIEWMNAVLNGAHKPCSSHVWRDIVFYLRDGVALCKFVNIILEANGQPAVKFKTNANTAFVSKENIDTFNEGAKLYGVPKDELFQSIDLYDGQKGPLHKVINTLNILGFQANAKGFTPQYEAVEAPSRDGEVRGNT